MLGKLCSRYCHSQTSTEQHHVLHSLPASRLSSSPNCTQWSFTLSRHCSNSHLCPMGPLQQCTSSSCSPTSSQMYRPQLLSMHQQISSQARTSYEGRLKTWECALNLAAYLDQDVLKAQARVAAVASGWRVHELHVLEVSSFRLMEVCCLIRCCLIRANVLCSVLYP
jgi:hypothetical protein